MEEEIEDLIGEMTYSGSVRSIAISNHRSLEFIDSERNISSGKGTYVLELDSEDSDGNFPLHESASIRNLHGIPRANSRGFCVIQPEVSSKAAGTSQHTCSIIAQETCTQTSKTIIELAQDAWGTHRAFEVNTLETQTSFLSVTRHGQKELSYGLETSSGIDLTEESDSGLIKRKPSFLDLTCTDFALQSSGGSSSKFQPVSDLSNESTNESDYRGNQNEPSKDTYGTRYGNNSDYDSFLYSDVDEDSLVDYSEKSAKFPSISRIEAPNPPDNTVDKFDIPTIKSAVTINKDQGDTGEDSSIDSNIKSSQVVEFETKQSSSCKVVSRSPVHYFDQHELEMHTFGTLSTLSEESTRKEEEYTKKSEESTNIGKESINKEESRMKNSLVDITPTNKLINTITLADTVKPKVEEDDVVFTSDRGMKVKVLKDHPIVKSTEPFKLPSIQNQSCPNSPHLISLFEKSKKLNKAGTLSCLHETMQKKISDRWEITNKNLASGEGKSITAQKPNDEIQLPPIHAEGPKENRVVGQTLPNTPPPDEHDTINIKEKIKELKMTEMGRRRLVTYDWKWTRSVSPGSSSSPDPESRHSEVVDRGCEALCVELLKKLRSNSWKEVMKTLDEMPKTMSKFWSVISEARIVDLIRQEFYETMTVLLNKTGSYSRPVRAAANVALDDIVCNVDLSHAVTALCIHGCGHKSPLVRCASARLLIVCCAVSGGGRDLLRARPTSAASARRLALQSLSTLLEDKNPETRKYAERLYGLLRHLSNFEAYYLTDVDVELASKQMQKYDQLLGIGERTPPRDRSRRTSARDSSR